MIRGWFIAGTDTAVGKTGVAETLLQALARKGLRAVGMKPVASGCESTPTGLRSDDAARLRAASSVMADYADVNPYALGPAIAPHIAAAQAGIEMRLEKVQHHFDRLAARADWIVVEGAGGWQVPLNRTKMLSDVARALGLPVILVVGVRLGCISHALLSARAIRADGLALAGWVANSVDEAFGTAAESIAAIDERIGAPCLARIPYSAQSWREYGDEMLARLMSE
jgi:dethiobiotin synthetase